MQNDNKEPRSKVVFAVDCSGSTQYRPGSPYWYSGVHRAIDKFPAVIETENSFVRRFVDASTYTEHVAIYWNTRVCKIVNAAEQLPVISVGGTSPSVFLSDNRCSGHFDSASMLCVVTDGQIDSTEVKKTANASKHTAHLPTVVVVVGMVDASVATAFVAMAKDALVVMTDSSGKYPQIVYSRGAFSGIKTLDFGQIMRVARNCVIGERVDPSTSLRVLQSSVPFEKIEETITPDLALQATTLGLATECRAFLARHRDALAAQRTAQNVDKRIHIAISLRDPVARRDALKRISGATRNITSAQAAIQLCYDKLAEL
jgi:hypothetical protein